LLLFNVGSGKSRQAADYFCSHDLEGPRMLVRNVAAAPLSGLTAPKLDIRRPARSSLPLVALRGMLQLYFVLLQMAGYDCADASS
jgi:hypothetical protein